MKDSLGNLFRERFQGHEVPVAPGTWQAIQSQMAAAAPVPEEPAPGQLKEKFEGHEVHVDPAVWQSISTQIGHGVAAGTSGGGFMGGLGWAAAGVAGLFIAGGLIYTLTKDEPIVEKTQPPVDVAEQVIAPVVTAQESAASMPELVAEPVRQEPTKNIGGSRGGSIGDPVERTIPEPDRTQPQENGTGPSTTITPEGPGAEVVNSIIAEMTQRVERDMQEPPPATEPSHTPDIQQPSSAQGVVDVREPLETTQLPELFLQNVFTPNGDGVNDVYEITSEGFTNTKIRVFSVKSNQLVFSSNTNEPWTGANCEDGYYMVAVEATTLDGRLVTDGKVVWLNRNSTN